LTAGAFNFSRPKQGSAYQADVAALETEQALTISTDPPYYDNIGYADLSDFFYVWQRRSLGGVYPSLYATLLVPKTTELIASPYRFDGDSDAATDFFESGLVRAFSQMKRIIPPEYPLTVYYAFKQQDADPSGDSSTGWETMLMGLIQTGFSIVGTWPVRTEMGSRMIGQGTNALASSIVLVCRPRPDDAPMTSRRAFVSELRQALPRALREMQSGNIAPVDLAQASIGPGMAVYSRYKRVLEPNGARLTVRAALQLINRVLDEYLAEQEGELDAASRFAVAWFEQFGFQAGAFGQADVLARAKNTSVDTLAHTELLQSGSGKVRLLKWDELTDDFDPDGAVTVWEATHRLVRALNTEGEAGVAAVLAALSPNVAAAARQLAYRLYAICERKGWSEPARDYNGLVVSWGASVEQARALREELQQGTLF
jgi:putative DNA methylase